MIKTYEHIIENVEQATERHMIARELHDEMSQYIASIHFYALSIIRESNTSSVVSDAQAIDQITSHISQVVHNNIVQLRNEQFHNIEQNFESMLETKISEWLKTNPHIIVDCKINGPFVTINTHILITFYRLLQESLSNITRHSKATHVILTIAVIDKSVVFRINDNGHGCNLDKNTDRFGLLGMRERVEECNGVLNLTSSKGKGFALNATIPNSLSQGRVQ
jgi:two-component system sensor histidine kinase UhpB